MTTLSSSEHRDADARQLLGAQIRSCFVSNGWTPGKSCFDGSIQCKKGDYSIDFGDLECIGFRSPDSYVVRLVYWKEKGKYYKTLSGKILGRKQLPGYMATIAEDPERLALFLKLRQEF